jgi:1,4-alpha-glucan branching enzyme
MWLDRANAWIYPHLHSAARRMKEIASREATTVDAGAERCLRQLARELLLAQSSDWPFLIKTGTAKNYASQRVNEHIARFNQLYEQLQTGTVNESFLSDCEARDNLFPQLEWRYYA